MSLPYPADDSHILEFYLVVKSTQAILKHIYSRHQVGIAPIGKYTWFPTYDRKWRVKYWKSVTNHLTDPTLKVAFSEFQPYLKLLDHLDREVYKQKDKDALDPLVIESLKQVGVAITQMLETLDDVGARIPLCFSQGMNGAAL